MNLNNKIFKDNRTGEVLKVIDSFENIAILVNEAWKNFFFESVINFT